MSDEVETLKPEDFVGWTVEVKDNTDFVPDGKYYCVGLTRFEALQLRGHGELTDPNPEDINAVNWWVSHDDGSVTRLEKGDHAP